MARCVWPLLAITLLAEVLVGCSRYDHPERPAWRNQAEEACLARHLVEPTAYLQPSHPINGPSICGLNHPFKVYALADGTVRLNSASLLDCSMIPALDAWIKNVVQPDAEARFGERVVQINTMGTYSCRGINNVRGAKLSEHAFANAMDVGGFVLASGREINVMRGWKSADLQESAFLHDSHAGACTYFTTVLGPGANIFHYNHVHMDLAMHGNTSHGPRRYCKPVPQPTLPVGPPRDTLPDPPMIEEEQDMAQAPIPAPSYSGGSSRSFVASVPDLAPSYRMARRQPVGAPMTLAPRSLAAHDALDLDQAGVGGATGIEDARPSDAPVPPEGIPADWDITSLIRHRASR